ncbi:hypothetical protein B9X75_12890 [Acinetobacter pittii]|uniref:hypothetical protein n=1 Tax=Acinetobacter pittii TaxID=48296 RepID=UPI000A34469E|nr:hypothetical protein [Acinetobacter pittii]OTL32573.1 hypothetical protein B9X75_12890 [Acinetobacter pittii]WQD15446.1 hypothetical protein U0544_18075 [Acinetobacter pittii]
MNKTLNPSIQEESINSENINGLHLNLSTIAQIKNIANQYQLSQDELVSNAIHFYAHHLSTQPISINAEESNK